MIYAKPRVNPLSVNRSISLLVSNTLRNLLSAPMVLIIDLPLQL